MIMPLPPCPGKDEVVRKYEVAAIHTGLIYNRYGDHDPDGLVFVPMEDVEQVLTGKYQPKPLILRVNTGEWLEVTLHKSASGSLDWLFYLSWFFYVLNIVEITIDMALYFRNVKLDQERDG